MTTSTQQNAPLPNDRHRILHQMRVGPLYALTLTALWVSICCSTMAQASITDIPPPTQTPELSAATPVDTTPEIPLPVLLEQAHTLALANDPIWQRLILFRGHAEVLSKGFYLSDPDATHRLQITPEQELAAALAAFQHTPSIACQYPARYIWLSGKLAGLPADRLSTCPNLPDVHQDIRMLLVSGYLKNPVSTFGHVLITIGQQGERHNLLDHAYNYGAIVPPGENGLSYATKGLLGFFNARFAASAFFKQDIIYAKTEQRDMWAYTLNLTPAQRALLIYHLYEVQSQAIGYYFIKQNCAYRSGELLELISDIHTTQHTAPWYPPIYIFDQIEEYRQQHPDFIQNVSYLPSDQSVVYARFAALPPSLQQVINHAIRQADYTQITHLAEADQIKALDFLIAYLNYKQAAQPSPRNAEQKKQLVRMRILLPASETDPLPITPRPSLALGEKPSKLALGVTHLAGNTQTQLDLTVYNKDLLSPDGNPHDAFKMLDFSLINQHGTTKLAKADFIQILKIEDLGQPLTGEARYSWQLGLGAKPDAYSGALLRPYAQLGIGAGYDFSPDLIGYSIFGGELNDSNTKLDLYNDTAIVYQHADLAAKLIEHLEQRKDKRLLHQTRFELQYRVAKNADIRLILAHQSQALSYQYYW